MAGKGKAKTPQAPRGQNQRQSAPNSAPPGKKGAVEESEVKLDALSTTPKTGAAKALTKKPNTPATPKGKQLTPAPRGQKTGQSKTPASPNRGGKRRAPVQQDSEDDDDDDDDDEEEEEDIEEDENQDEEDMDNDMEDDDDDNDPGKDAIFKKIRELRETSKNSKGQQMSAVKTKVQENKEQPQTASKTQKPLTPKKEKEGKLQEPAKAAESANRDKCTLFVKNLPPSLTVSNVKALSEDIKEVRLRMTVRSKRRESKKTGFAFLEFASEAVAEKNYKQLQGVKLEGWELVVDYVGEKSKNAPAKAREEVADPDPLRLFITGFGTDMHEGDLHRLFPKAQQISLPRRNKDKSTVGYAFATFATEQQCKTALQKTQGSAIKGHKLVVLPAKKRPQTNQKGKGSEKKTEPPAKKTKTTNGKHGGDDEEDDDDDDDEEDDDSDDEENGGLDDDEEEDDDDEEDDSDDDD